MQETTRSEARIARTKVKILTLNSKKKVRIVQVNLRILRKKSESQDANLELWEKKPELWILDTEFQDVNLEFWWKNVWIVRFQVAIVRNILNWD